MEFGFFEVAVGAELGEAVLEGLAAGGLDFAIRAGPRAKMFSQKLVGARSSPDHLRRTVRRPNS